MPIQTELISPTLPRRVGTGETGAAAFSPGGTELGTGGGAVVGTGGGAVDGRGGGAVVGLAGEYCGTCGGSCTDSACTLGITSEDFVGFIGRDGFEGVPLKSDAGADSTAWYWMGACGAVTYAAEVGGGPDGVDGTGEAVDAAPPMAGDFAEALAVPPGASLPIKQ